MRKGWILGIVALVAGFSQASAQGTLNVYNWNDYVSP